MNKEIKDKFKIKLLNDLKKLEDIVFLECEIKILNLVEKLILKVKNGL